MMKTLEEINAKYKGFKITGRIEYNDAVRELLCYLTAKKEGFDDLFKSGYTYNRVFNDIKVLIDETLRNRAIIEKAKAFVLMPFAPAPEEVTMGDIELFTKTKHGWVSVDEPDDVVTEVGKAWEIYGHLWIPIPTTQKALTNKQEKQLNKLQSEIMDMCVDYVLAKATEILQKEDTQCTTITP